MGTNGKMWWVTVEMGKGVHLTNPLPSNTTVEQSIQDRLNGRFDYDETNDWKIISRTDTKIVFQNGRKRSERVTYTFA